MINILDGNYRKEVLKEITGHENQMRKLEAFKRYEVYKERQDKYIIEKLREEFSEETVSEMRKILSINLCPVIVNSQASIYETEPIRNYGPDMTEDEDALIKELDESGRKNRKMKRANRIFKLQNQGAIMVVPRGKVGEQVIDLIPLNPHQYDVIPSEDDPEVAEVYIISSFDKSFLVPSDGQNQKLADKDDYKKSMRFTWWSKDFNFITDKDGNITSGLEEKTNQPTPNAIQELPILDIASDDKDFEFWVRRGSSAVDFALDFAKILSDTTNINQLQGYAQAVIYSKDKPKEFMVGPKKVLHIPIDEESKKDARFEFVTPSPDMASSLELLDILVKLFLSSKEIDPKAVSGKAQTQKFTSAAERWLALVEEFQASKDDFDLFRALEMKVFELQKKWINAFHGTSNSPLKESLRKSKIREELSLSVSFAEPQLMQSQSEIETSVIRQVKEGLMTKTEAIMKIRGVDEDKAIEIVEKIEAEQETVVVLEPPGPMNV